MPKSKVWPFPLVKGTKVVVRLRGLEGHEDQSRGGVIVTHERKERYGDGYRVQFAPGQGGWFASSRCKPVDTNTVEGLEEWLA